MATSAFPCLPSLCHRSLSADSHTPLAIKVCTQARRNLRILSAYQVQSPALFRINARLRPRAPLHTPGVTLCAAAFPAASEGITPPSSLLRAHGPYQNPPAVFGFPCYGRSLQVVVSPCREMVLPGVISAILVQVLGPLPRGVSPVRLPVSSRKASASPHGSQVRHAGCPSQCSFCEDWISGLQSFLYVRAPILVRPPGCSHR